jgi:gliding motility-associated-like protein
MLRVYNNWGNLIFESDDVTVGWDGTHKGKDQPKGDYVYSAIVIGLDGKEYIKKGSISIIR